MLRRRLFDIACTTVDLVPKMRTSRLWRSFFYKHTTSNFIPGRNVVPLPMEPQITTPDAVEPLHTIDDQIFHDALFAFANCTRGGVGVLWGPPGCGKSIHLDNFMNYWVQHGNAAYKVDCQNVSHTEQFGLYRRIQFSMEMPGLEDTGVVSLSEVLPPAVDFQHQALIVLEHFDDGLCTRDLIMNQIKNLAVDSEGCKRYKVLIAVDNEHDFSAITWLNNGQKLRGIEFKYHIDEPYSRIAASKCTI